MVMLRHILAVLCPYVPNNTYHDRWIGRRASTSWPPRLLDSAPVGNEEAFHHRILDACQAIRIYLGIFERMRRPMMGRDEACTEGNILST
jgi:hypothetical protein